MGVGGSRRWGLRVGLLGVVLLLVLGAGVRGSAIGSASFERFSAAASTQSLAVELVDTGAPVLPEGQVLNAAPTVTRVALDSAGNSTGFAAGPYPGDTLPGLMGATNAVAPAPIVPAYPFAVSSRYPGNEETAQENGPHRLEATSAEDSSQAEAHVGLGRVEGDGLGDAESAGGDGLVGGENGAGAVGSDGDGLVMSEGGAVLAMNGEGALAVGSILSTSRVEHVPGALTAEATSVLDGVSVGSMLKIARVSAHAEVSARAGQTPTKETSFELGTVTVAGTKVGLTDEGLAPVGGTPPEGELSALSDQLADAGITLNYLPAEKTDSRVRSAGLEIGLTRELPGRTVEVTTVLGRVSAKAGGTAAEASDGEFGFDSGTESSGDTAGTASDGTADSGTVSDGTADSGTASDGTANSGTAGAGGTDADVGAREGTAGAPSASTPSDESQGLSRGESTTPAAQAATQPLGRDLGSEVYLTMAGMLLVVLLGTGVFARPRPLRATRSLLGLPTNP